MLELCMVHCMVPIQPEIYLEGTLYFCGQPVRGVVHPDGCASNYLIDARWAESAFENCARCTAP